MHIVRPPTAARSRCGGGGGGAARRRCGPWAVNPLERSSWLSYRVPHEILFAIGGWSGGSPTNFIETYDTRADRWVKVR